MKRVFLTVLDACGVGELPDAADYGDVGACTIGHAVDACHPSLPNMAHMGLGRLPARIIRRMKTPSVRSACAVKPARARIRRRATGRLRA